MMYFVLIYGMIMLLSLMTCTMNDWLLFSHTCWMESVSRHHPILHVNCLLMMLCLRYVFRTSSVRHCWSLIKTSQFLCKFLLSVVDQLVCTPLLPTLDVNYNLNCNNGWSIRSFWSNVRICSACWTGLSSLVLVPFLNSFPSTASSLISPPKMLHAI